MRGYGICEIFGNFAGDGVVESYGVVAEFVEEGEGLRELGIGGFPGDVKVVEHVGALLLCCVIACEREEARDVSES